MQTSNPVAADQRAAPSVYFGLFFIALSTLMYEILLTRIFSVTMWYHFAFVAISIAMFGMTVGALVVYLYPHWFPEQALASRMALAALWCAASMILSFLAHLSIPLTFEFSFQAGCVLAFTYAIIAVPFIFSGMCVSIALTRFPHSVGTLYAVDLLGAALGCVLLIGLLNVTDGPTAVLVVAALAGLASVGFLLGQPDSRLKWCAFLVTALMAIAAVGHTALVQQQMPLVRLRWVKGVQEPLPLYERWNSFSRITVFGDPESRTRPKSWGLSAAYPRNRLVHQLFLLIDATAGTVLTALDGAPDALEYLKYDVTNIVHYLRQPGRVLVIGAGGGRDVLAALVFGQPSVVAVEINGDILRVVNRVFGEFTGHLDQDPRVTFVNDEARSYVTRQPARFDIIQMSLIDTWAATAAGAFVLTEHSLYTLEAWRVFLERLTDRGMLTVSRYYVMDRPDEMYRLTSLASSALRAVGVEEPRAHIAIVRQLRSSTAQPAKFGVATILVSRSPFSSQDLTMLRDIADRLQFDLVLSPGSSIEPDFAVLASGQHLSEVAKRFPINVMPPTDDSPFFFHMLRPGQIFNPQVWTRQGDSLNVRAVSVLGMLFITVVALTILCIAVPLVLRAGSGLAGCGLLAWFFASIGLGFMLVEISLMQQLMIFLGHPVYGLSVVLFTLLLFSGVGSLLSAALSAAGPTQQSPRVLFGALLGVLCLFGLLTPPVLVICRGAITPVRIGIAVALLAPLGCVMGTAFPLGMTIASNRSARLTPWLWGINGATSVCASVLAVVIALSAGITATFWSGVCAYLVAFGALLRETRRPDRQRVATR